jgi:ketosteroid isomerase-like protein
MVRGQMPYGLSEAEIEWVREGYRMFREGNPAFMDRFEPDAKFIFPATLPSGGTYEGAFEALEFWTTVGELFENPYPDPEEFLRVGDRLIVFGTWRGRSAQTGDGIALRFVHLQRLNDEETTLMDQKIVSVELFVDTAAYLQAIGPAAPR